jgi:hypothetical protein
VARRIGVLGGGAAGIGAAPALSLVPYPLRARLAHALPASHRQSWHEAGQAKGPAV